jgi:hypothetical protein
MNKSNNSQTAKRPTIITQKIRGNSISVQTDHWLDDRGLISGRGRDFVLRHEIQTVSANLPHPSFLPWRYRGLFSREQSGYNVYLTPDLNLVPKSKIHGDGPYTPSPHHKDCIIEIQKLRWTFSVLLRVFSSGSMDLFVSDFMDHVSFHSVYMFKMWYSL